ncbi:cytochrome c [Octadecabacter sp. SW4]|uniref:c-type cytochrome n=1 Tax=Octadecabacter sp. SW4 TaxID=2602067 RepID=UPI0011C20D13|nr:c-type cytochrome [Octadecabacter sp. SW4]QEE35353.1 cytochrome c [Octadecabacter sp. SW4]
MQIRTILTTTVVLLSSSPALAQDNDLTLGQSSYGARCAICHGVDGKGGGEVAELFRIPPTDLTKLAERAGGRFPFVDVYYTLARGIEQPGHGDAEMPVWGDYFVADSLVDRGVSSGDAVAIAAGRLMTLTLYLESIQE